MNYGVALNITILNWEKCGSIKMEYFRDDAGGGHIITYTIHHRHFQLCGYLQVHGNWFKQVFLFLD